MTTLSRLGLRLSILAGHITTKLTLVAHSAALRMRCTLNWRKA